MVSSRPLAQLEDPFADGRDNTDDDDDRGTKKKKNRKGKGVAPAGANKIGGGRKGFTSKGSKGGRRK